MSLAIRLQLAVLLAAPAGAAQIRHAAELEMEYALRPWRATAAYLANPYWRREDSLITGYRFQYRLRPIARDLPVNPVFQLEFEDSNGADRDFDPIVGRAAAEEFVEPGGEPIPRDRAFEARLILDSGFKGWTLTEDFIADKPLDSDPVAFGYAFAAARACPRNLRAGLELFGGLGDLRRFGFSGTSHYLAPTLSWEAPGGLTLLFSPAIGLNGTGVLWRFSVSYDVGRAAAALADLFR